MKVAVWDTYVKRKDSLVMHFDIMVPAELKDTDVIYDYGRKYLESKGQTGQPLTSKECQLCHIEMAEPKWEDEINLNGYYIYEMENCE
jgi:hypothetical protein